MKFLSMAVGLGLAGCNSGAQNNSVDLPVLNDSTDLGEMNDRTANGAVLRPDAPGLQKICFVVEPREVTEAEIKSVLTALERLEGHYGRQGITLRLHKSPEFAAGAPRIEFLEPCLPPAGAADAPDGVLVVRLPARDGSRLRLSRGADAWEEPAQGPDVAGRADSYLRARIPRPGPGF